VAAAGDVNQDGFADLIFGSPKFDHVGAAFILPGSPNGLVEVPIWQVAGPSRDSAFGVSASISQV
jgi:hypothetical protein